MASRVTNAIWRLLRNQALARFAGKLRRPAVALAVATSGLAVAAIAAEKPYIPVCAYAKQFAPTPVTDKVPLVVTAQGHDSTRQNMERLLRHVQQQLVNGLEDLERSAGSDAKMIEDITVVREGASPQNPYGKPDGKPTTLNVVRVIQGGKVFTKAGVNLTVSNRDTDLSKYPDDFLADHPRLKKAIADRQAKGASTNANLFTASLSMVFHPINPFAPTMHANYRMFEYKFDDGEKVWWFGGGSDLTPRYLNEEDATWFHTSIKRTLDSMDSSLYKPWKKNCDEYFKIGYRGETRGIGGIFFDDYQHNGDRTATFELVSALANSIAQSYFPIIQARFNTPYEAQHQYWRDLRWGRYVEFNLYYDKGTKYGLQLMPQRHEAILMSMPPTPRFEYKHVPEPGSPEAQTLQVLRNPREWAK